MTKGAKNQLSNGKNAQKATASINFLNTFEHCFQRDEQFPVNNLNMAD